MHILDREACKSVRYIQTTITKANKASWALFERVAKNYRTSLSSENLFTQNKHFSGQHDTETLVTIGPLVRDRYAANSIGAIGKPMNTTTGS